MLCAPPIKNSERQRSGGHVQLPRIALNLYGLFKLCKYCRFVAARILIFVLWLQSNPVYSISPDAGGPVSREAKHEELGDQYVEDKEYDKAITEYSKGLSFVTDKYFRSRLYADLAMAHCLKGEFKQSVANDTRALAIDPAMITVYGSRGAAYMQLKQYDNAIRDFRRILSCRPNDESVLFDLGVCLSKLGKKQEAIASFNKALQGYDSRHNSRMRSESLRTIQMVQKGVDIPIQKPGYGPLRPLP